VRVLVCGGRGYRDSKTAWSVLGSMDVELVIHGGASGADAIAGEWARFAGVPCLVFPASWLFYGKRAGPVRNAWMLKYGRPDLVLAFPGGPGTENMIQQAKAAGIPVRLGVAVS